jgi:hypothetical protein
MAVLLSLARFVDGAERGFAGGRSPDAFGSAGLPENGPRGNGSDPSTVARGQGVGNAFREARSAASCARKPSWDVFPPDVVVFGGRIPTTPGGKAKSGGGTAAPRGEE